MNFREFITEGSVRDYVNDRLNFALKKEGFGKVVQQDKIGYTKFPFDYDLSIVNDGVGVEVKQGNKSLYYGDTPKLDYKKAIEIFINKYKEEMDNE